MDLRRSACCLLLRPSAQFVLTMTRVERILEALKDGPMDTGAIAEAIGVHRPGSSLHWLEIDRKIKRVGTKPGVGRRPLVMWALVA